MNLVELTSKRLDAEPFTTAEIISKYAEIDLRTVNNRINQYKSDLLEFGALRFSTINVQNSNGGRPRKQYLLNEQQATLLITYLGNTKPVRNFKKVLTREFKLLIWETLNQ